MTQPGWRSAKSDNPYTVLAVTPSHWRTQDICRNIPNKSVRYSLHLDNELLSVDLSLFEMTQPLSDLLQPAFPQLDLHRLEQARFEELGDFLRELVDVVVVLF